MSTKPITQLILKAISIKKQGSAVTTTSTGRKLRSSLIPLRIDALRMSIPAITIHSWSIRSQRNSITMEITITSPGTAVTILLWRSLIPTPIQIGTVSTSRKMSLISSIRKTMICFGKQWSLLSTHSQSTLWALA